MLLLVAGEELAEKLLLRASSKLCKVEKERPIGFVSRPSNRDSTEEIAGGFRYLLTLIIRIISIGLF